MHSFLQRFIVQYSAQNTPVKKIIYKNRIKKKKDLTYRLQLKSICCAPVINVVTKTRNIQ